MKKNSDYPAFPITYEDNSSVKPGLTKREYFAAMAMQGLLSQHLTKEVLNELPPPDFEPVFKTKFISNEPDYEQLCRDAIEVADELLNQLTK